MNTQSDKQTVTVEKKSKLLVFGAGQLGQELKYLLSQSPSFDLAIYDYPVGDITSLEKVTKLAQEEGPQFIINAAAYTAVDKAESDEANAFAVNATGPHNLALLAKNLDIPLIHVSTDYVFSGDANEPYQTDDLANPQSSYGRTKLAGEWAVQALWPKHFIIRTAWVYSVFGNNFVKTMLRLGEERDELKIVGDQIGSPTNARDLAQGIIDLCLSVEQSSQEVSGAELQSAPYGIYHYTNSGECSWYDFASEIFRLAKERGLKTPSTVKPIKTEEYPTPAKRPAYSVLSLDKMSKLSQIRPWEKGLKDFFDEMS